ncbi:MAG: dihydrofolate reductase family protein [Bacteroidales bacterium]
MRKLIILSFITLDGVMQAPGGPEEDTSGGFKYGGWSFPFFDDFMGNIMFGQMNHDFDLLLGRKTYDIFASYWPFQDTGKDPIAAGLNKARKYVVSESLVKAEWSNSIIINGDVPEEIRKIKESDGPEMQVHGSGNLIQTLWKYNLADELWLKIFPVALGSGKRLFTDGNLAGGFELFESKTSPSGVIIANYKKSGEIKTGSFGN